MPERNRFRARRACVRRDLDTVSAAICTHTAGMSEPSAHPPSPRRQRADAAHLRASPTRKRVAPRVGYLRLHWRGALPLAATVIVSATLVWGVVRLVACTSRRQESAHSSDSDPP